MKLTDAFRSAEKGERIWKRQQSSCVHEEFFTVQRSPALTPARPLNASASPTLPPALPPYASAAAFYF